MCSIGSVLTTGSLWSPAPGEASGPLARYTELAAQDLAPRIRVNAIAAGTIATAATEAGFSRWRRG